MPPLGAGVDTTVLGGIRLAGLELVVVRVAG
jgi:hypothetical protein